LSSTRVEKKKNGLGAAGGERGGIKRGQVLCLPLKVGTEKGDCIQMSREGREKRYDTKRVFIPTREANGIKGRNINGGSQEGGISIVLGLQSGWKLKGNLTRGGEKKRTLTKDWVFV